ncbi:MAG TPA: hypothetical protein VFT31_11460 [Kribbella sp.]|nr:hypothetical protein [Kribbella sp.]
MRRLTRADLDWVLDLSAARRERLVPFAPRFWNPAPAARDVHRDFLGSLIDSPRVLSIRTDEGFLFGVSRDGILVVDDFALEHETAWPLDGSALLRGASEEGRVRLVCPVPESARRLAAAEIGLVTVESWWHRDLDPLGGPVEAGDDCRLVVEGAAGQLVPAPPVYAPGGPVLLVTEVANAVALSAIEQAAVRRGAPVSVVTLPPDDPRGAQLLEPAGYRRTTDFLEQPVTRRPVGGR